MRKPSVSEPPTLADLAEYGPAACLDALREEFTEAHKQWDQYRGWTDGTVLGVVACQIGGGNSYTQAEAGDLVLVKRDRWRGGVLVGLDPDDVAYMPRVGWNVSITYADVRDIPVEAEATR